MESYTPLQLLLKRIKDERCGGNAAELARRLNKDASYINRLFYPPGKKGAKGIGLEIMDACSKAFDLPPGYWSGAQPAEWPLGDKVTPAVWASLDPLVKGKMLGAIEQILRDHRASLDQLSEKSAGSQAGANQRRAAA